MASTQDFVAALAGILPDLVPYLVLIWLFAVITAAVGLVRSRHDEARSRHPVWSAALHLFSTGGAFTLFVVASDAQSRDMISLQSFIVACIFAWLAGTAPYWAVRV